MAQPLPSWLKPVTLRYQDSDRVTTGLVELPITYSGPSIPLDWPYTSVSSSSITAASPASSALPSTQIVKFLDGSGPFTVVGDTILTAPTPTSTTSAEISAPSSAVPSSMPVTSSPPVPLVLVTTVVVAQPTPASTPLSSNSPTSPSSNPLALGFVFLLTILIILILIATVVLIKRQRRRRKLRGIIDKYEPTPQEIHYEFNSRLYPQHHHGSQDQPHYIQPSREQEAPGVNHEHEELRRLNDDTKEKPDQQTEFLLTPSGKLARTDDRKWARWNKFLPKLPFFGNKKPHRPEIIHHLPLPQTTPIYVNPYHDPSVNTNTGERVSKWRVKCGSFSSSALKLPSTISSYKNELPPEPDIFQQQTPVKNGGLPDDPQSAISAIQRGDAKLVFSYNQSSTVSGPRGKSQSRAYQALKQSPPSSPIKAKSMEAVYTLFDLSSPRRGVKSQSPKPKKTIIPSALFKIPTHTSRSFGNKTSSNSWTTGKKSTSKRHSDHDPPLLVGECEEDDEASHSDGTDPGDSPLDFITIPLRSPPRCRRITGSSLAGVTGLEDSIDSIGDGPRSLPPSTPTAPLFSSARKVRPKKNSLPALPQSSMANQLNASTSSDDHFPAPLRRSPDYSSPPLLPSLPIARVPTPELKRANEPSTSRCTPQFGRARTMSHSPVIMNDLSRNQSSLDTNLSHEAHRNDTSRSHEYNSGLSSDSSRASPQYPRDPSCEASPNGSSSHDLPELQPTQQAKSGSQETHNTSADEDIIFTGYFGSGSIGNTGGVSEMGILETN